MDHHWGNFVASEQEAVITVSCRLDDEQNEKREEEEEEVCREANQRDFAAWFSFVSGSSKIYSYCRKEKPAIEYSYTNLCSVDFRSSFVMEC